MLAGAFLLLLPAAVHAQTVWDMPTEYPQSAMPGLGLTTFTKYVAELRAGKLQIRPSFDAASGIKSAGDAAGRKTESELWVALSTRLQENYQRMRANNVTIDTSPAPAVIAALQSGAAVAQRAWCTRSGPVCAQILDAFKAGKP